MATNSDNIDLSNWRMTLPVDKNGKDSGKALTVRDLIDYEHSKYFYDAPDGAMVFRAPVGGARTSSNTKYVRTELREADGEDKAAWTLDDGGTMTATLKVDEVPVKNDGDDGRIIVGQIHGSKDELVRLYYENDEVYFMNEHSKDDGKEHRFDLKNSKGDTPDVSEGEIFSYKIEVEDNTLQVEVGADGDTYASTTKIHSFWENDTFYFKAGLYLGVNEKTGDGWGQVSFYELAFNHGEEDLVLAATDQNASEEVAYVGTLVSYLNAADAVKVDLRDSSNNAGIAEDVDHYGVSHIAGSHYIDNLKGNDDGNFIYGGDGKDYLYGRGGTDKLVGGEGDDQLHGGAGRDVLLGGEGEDIFIFDKESDSIQEQSLDEVRDFEQGIDLIDLSKLGFVDFDNDGGITESNELRLAYSEETNRTYVRSDQEDFEFYILGDFTDLGEESFLF